VQQLIGPLELWEGTGVEPDPPDYLIGVDPNEGLENVT